MNDTDEDETDFKQFFIIIREDGVGDSRVRHGTQDQALTEAPC